MAYFNPIDYSSKSRSKIKMATLSHMYIEIEGGLFRHSYHECNLIDISCKVYNDPELKNLLDELRRSNQHDEKSLRALRKVFARTIRRHEDPTLRHLSIFKSNGDFIYP